MSLDQKTGTGGGGTGLVYDARCDGHGCDNGHVESAARTASIWSALKVLTGRCTVLDEKELLRVDDTKLRQVHSKTHLENVANATYEASKTKSCHFIDDDTYLCQNSDDCARLSCGGLLSLCDRVANGSLINGFAAIRPPGHHADIEAVQGFCMYNNVAVAAEYLRNQYKETIARVLIVDWDVHHGNGTENIFWNRTDVCYMSIHRYDDGKFYPRTGHAENVGGTAAKGFNINIPYNGSFHGDPEYLLAFSTIIVPIAQAYKPDFILVSAGFDCVKGDPLGDQSVTPSCFAHLTRQLMQVQPKIVLALEGGYNLQQTAEAAKHCVQSLLHDPLPTLLDTRKPNDSFQTTIQKVTTIHSHYWPNIKPLAPTPTPLLLDLAPVMQKLSIQP
jgi:histone deacetylase 6